MKQQTLCNETEENRMKQQKNMLLTRNKLHNETEKKNYQWIRFTICNETVKEIIKHQTIYNDTVTHHETKIL